MLFSTIEDPLRFVLVPDPDGAPEQMTDALPQEQRVTAPLKRDNSLVNPSPVSNVHGPGGDLTQPVAPQAPQPTAAFPSTPSRAYPATSQQPPVQHTAMAPPVSAPRSAPGRGGSTPITPLGWAVRGLCLVGVALVSFLIVSAIKHSGDEADQDQPPNPGPQTKYQYTPIMRQEGQQACAAVATDKIKSYLTQHPCQHLTRALYTTNLPDGQKVLVSVITVRMPDPASAAKLNELTSKDKTGNIQDLVESGHDLPAGLPSLEQDSGYSSDQQDSLVVLGESAYFSKRSNPDDPVLKDVTQDALRNGWPQEKAPS